MKMLYLGKVDMENMTSGVTVKVKHQQNIFNNNNIQVDNLNYSNDSLWKKINNRLPIFIDFYSLAISNHLKNINDYDVYYFRRFPITRHVIENMNKIKKRNPSAVILVEIPTYPYDGEISGISGKLLLFIDKINRRKLHKYANRILTYSKYDTIFSIPTIKLANGLIMEHISPSNHCNVDNSDINVIAVAKMELWQGYDRMIQGLYEYYSRSSKNIKRNIILHLVGDGNEIKRYKKLVDDYNLSNSVIFYGKLYGDKLDDVYNKCSIAVSSLGKHRINVFYDSVLKDKEYAAKGLPIVSAVRTEFDDMVGYKYYKYFENNDDPINIDEFISFYDFIYVEDCLSVSKNIRNFAEMNFDMKHVLKPIIEYVKENKGTN